MTIRAGIIVSSLLVIALSTSLTAQVTTARPPAAGQRHEGANPDAPDPIAKLDSVWIEKTVENGKKLIDLRANIAVEAIRKALQE